MRSKLTGNLLKGVRGKILFLFNQYCFEEVCSKIDGAVSGENQFAGSQHISQGVNCLGPGKDIPVWKLNFISSQR